MKLLFVLLLLLPAPAFAQRIIERKVDTLQVRYAFGRDSFGHPVFTDDGYMVLVQTMTSDLKLSITSLALDSNKVLLPAGVKIVQWREYPKKKKEGFKH